MKIIPFAIYPIISIIGTGLLIVGVFPKVFRLRNAYKCFMPTPINDTHLQNGSILNFIIPIAVLVIFTITTLNIAFGLILAVSITIAWLSVSTQFHLTESVDAFIKGMGYNTTCISNTNTYCNYL